MTQQRGMFSLADLVDPEKAWQRTQHGIFMPPAGLGLPSPLAAQGIIASAMAPAQYGLGGVSASPALQGNPPWMFVIRRFEFFLSNLNITDNQRADAMTKYKGLVATLNNAYYGHKSESFNAFLIGSWGKDTHIRPPRDVDMYFILPAEVYYRLEGYAAGSNKQSALLQEVKAKLLPSYPNSIIRGDGPVVSADFHGWAVEIVPVFLWSQDEQSYYVCDTTNGGRYIKTMPLREIVAINAAERQTNNNVRPLIRMLKCWQSNCNVRIKSFHLELMAIEFLQGWQYRDQGLYYYDWLCRDFFKWMIDKANGFLFAPGTMDFIYLDDAWKTLAESAYIRAAKAAELEKENKMVEAGEEWQKIFGSDIYRWV